jgi:hypothetical protein
VHGQRSRPVALHPSGKEGIGQKQVERRNILFNPP